MYDTNLLLAMFEIVSIVHLQLDKMQVLPGEYLRGDWQIPRQLVECVNVHVMHVNTTYIPDLSTGVHCVHVEYLMPMAERTLT
jgi:hypothetical protein